MAGSGSGSSEGTVLLLKYVVVACSNFDSVSVVFKLVVSAVFFLRTAGLSSDGRFSHTKWM